MKLVMSPFLASAGFVSECYPVWGANGHRSRCILLQTNARGAFL